MIRSLDGRRAAITRAASSSATLGHRIEQAGGVALARPCIAIERVADHGEMRDALRMLGADDWVIFTSRHAVRAFAEATSDEWTAAAWRRQCAAIGATTAQALAEHGLVASIVASQPSAQALVTTMGSLAGRTVLYPTSNLASDDVVNGVHAAGGNVRRVTAYRTIPGNGI